jgi:UDPglucose 6-dehydrogenase
MKDYKNIGVIGLGYVGASLAVLLSKKNKVIAHDIDSTKVNLLKNKLSPVKDDEITNFLTEESLDLVATLSLEDAVVNSHTVILALPTNFCDKSNSFDTSIIEELIPSILKINNNILIVIKSTVPIGFTSKMVKKYFSKRIIFSPEFLREGSALYDNLYPSRIIIGGDSKLSEFFLNILKSSAAKQEVDSLLMSSNEAEAVKLFSNTYLAMRVAYFNELDNFALSKDLDTKNIIDGVSKDPRIGNFYNNPSFGYGGYCLPKDTRQLLSNFDNVGQSLIESIVESNQIRKEVLIHDIIKKSPKIVGIYRLQMKSGSDNFRFSSIHDIIKGISEANIDIVIFEPTIENDTFLNYKIENRLDVFKGMSSLIVANRNDSNDLNDVMSKIYTRDVYKNN